MAIVGIFSVEDGVYVPYQGMAIAIALERIKKAYEVVTYNGRYRDLPDLARFAELAGDFPLNGKHTDMRSICWSDRIWGSDLVSTYKRHYPALPEFSETANPYVADNQGDVYMTYKLWELWKQGKLKVLDAVYR